MSSSPRARLRKLRVDGAELHYVECGNGEPLVLVHGGSGDYRSWQRQLASFSTRFRVIAYSRRYSYPNENAPLPEHSIATDAGDLISLIETLTPGRVHLVGHSYGALTALVASLQRPSIARTLVLAEPPLPAWVQSVPGGAAIVERMAKSVWGPVRQAFDEGQSLLAMRIFTDGLCGAGYFDRLPECERARRMDNARAVQLLLQTRGSFPPPSRERARRLTVPTLIVAGEHTTRLHRVADDELMRCIPGCARSIIQGATHWVAYDSPAMFNRTVLGFLMKDRSQW